MVKTNYLHNLLFVLFILFAVSILIFDIPPYQLLCSFYSDSSCRIFGNTATKDLVFIISIPLYVIVNFFILGSRKPKKVQLMSRVIIFIIIFCGTCLFLLGNFIKIDSKSVEIRELGFFVRKYRTDKFLIHREYVRRSKTVGSCKEVIYILTQDSLKRKISPLYHNTKENAVEIIKKYFEENLERFPDSSKCS